MDLDSTQLGIHRIAIDQTLTKTKNNSTVNRKIADEFQFITNHRIVKIAIKITKTSLNMPKQTILLGKDNKLTKV